MFKPTLTPARAAAAIEAAAALFEVSACALTGSRGTPRTARARQLTMAALFEAYDTSYSELGRLFGRHHTTVMHAVDRAAAAAQDDPDLAAAVALIAQAPRTQ